jgi:hypothetical protein
MRVKSMVGCATLLGFALMVGVGCNSEPEIAKAPPTKGGEVKPLPKEIRKGCGPGSSGNMKTLPGADT